MIAIKMATGGDDIVRLRRRSHLSDKIDALGRLRLSGGPNRDFKLVCPAEFSQFLTGLRGNSQDRYTGVVKKIHARLGPAGGNDYDCRNPGSFSLANELLQGGVHAAADTQNIVQQGYRAPEAVPQASQIGGAEATGINQWRLDCCQGRIGEEP